MKLLLSLTCGPIVLAWLQYDSALVSVALYGCIDSMNGGYVDTTCKVFYWRKSSRKGKGNHYKWTPLLHKFTVIAPVCWYNEDSFCLTVWFQWKGGGMKVKEDEVSRSRPQ